MSPTLVYAPAVKAIINTGDRAGMIDISGDLVAGNLALRGDGVGLHRFRFTLLNHRRKYDGLFMPNDTITVQMKRFTFMTVMTGYLNTVPFFSLFPRTVGLDASCTFKRLQFWMWDAGSAAAVNLLTLDGDTNDPSNLEGAVTERVSRLLTEVAGWDSKRIHMSGIPSAWLSRIQELRLSLGPKIDFTGRTYDEFAGTSGNVGGTTTIPPGQGDLTYGIIGSGAGQGVLPWTRGVATDYGESFDAGGSNAKKDSSLKVNIPGGKNPQTQENIGFGDYAGGYWCAYRMTYVGADKVDGSAPNANAPTAYHWKVRDYLLSQERIDAVNWWAKQKLLIVNTKTFKAVCVAVTDWGPEAGDNRNVDMSYKAKKVIMGDDRNPDVLIRFAHRDTPYGPVNLAADQVQGWITDTPQTQEGIGGGIGTKVFPVAGLSITDTSDTFDAPRSGGRKHAGIDILAPDGLPGRSIVSVVAGKITKKHDQDTGNGGVTVTVTEPSGVWHFYSHLVPGSLTPKAVGDSVSAGDYLGAMGDTGNAKGTVHLHYSVNNSGSDTTGNYGGENPLMNPYAYLGGSIPIQSVGGAQTGSGGPYTGTYAGVQATLEGTTYGGLRAILNDTSLLPFIQQLMRATGRSCCAAPNGDFISWFPDYFDRYGMLGKMVIRDVEMLDATIDWNDETFVTHQFTATAGYLNVGSNTPSGTIESSILPMTSGIATIEFPEIMEALFAVNSIPDKSPLAIFKDSGAMLSRFGVRPNFEAIEQTDSREAEFWLAINLFAERWTNQFSINVPLTWMPEIFPGMIVQFESLGIQLYVDGVSHSFDFRSGNFSTTLNAKAPSKTDGSGFFIPTDFKGKR